MKRLPHLQFPSSQFSQHSPAYRSRIVLCAVMLSTLLGVANPQALKAASCVNLVVDSGLESGSGWVTKSSGGYPVLSGRLTHLGKQAAYLAGANDAYDRLATSVKLPTNPQSITLTFWWQIQSQESGRYQDSLSIDLVDAQGKLLQNLDNLSSRNMSNQWQQRTLTISKAAGQTVQLQFVAHTDAEAATDFFVDDVEIVACS